MGIQAIDPLRGAVSPLVSIQLGSPASGDDEILADLELDFSCFHSIRIPSEWGSLLIPAPSPRMPGDLVSIQLGSPASGDLDDARATLDIQSHCFHSIRIPSEWGYLPS